MFWEKNNSKWLSFQHGTWNKANFLWKVTLEIWLITLNTDEATERFVYKVCIQFLLLSFLNQRCDIGQEMSESRDAGNPFGSFWWTLLCRRWSLYLIWNWLSVPTEVRALSSANLRFAPVGHKPGEGSLSERRTQWSSLVHSSWMCTQQYTAARVEPIPAVWRPRRTHFDCSMKASLRG